MSDRVVREEFDLSTEKAESSIKRLINRLSELKTATKQSNNADVGTKETSAIDAQIQKIGDLKAQIGQLKSLYAQLQSAITKSLGAQANQSASFPGTKDYSKYTAQVQQLDAQIESVRSSLAAVGGLSESTFSNGDVQAKIYSLTNALKEEEAELKRLQAAERGEASSNQQVATTAQRTASSQKSLRTALNGVGRVLQTVKSKISSVVGGFKNLASTIKGAIPQTNLFKGALGKLGSMVKRLVVYRLLRNAISAISNAMKEGVQNVAQYSAALNGLDANNANKAMSELASTGAYLKNVLGSALIPILNQMLPVIRSIATAFATAVNYVNQFMSALGGKSSWTKAKQVTVDYASTLNNAGSAAGSAKDAVEDLKRTILGFDEINKLNDTSSASGNSGGGSGGGGSDSVNYADMFEEVPIDNKVMQWLKDLKPYIDAIKTAWGDVKQSISDLVSSEGFKYLVGEVFKGALKGIATILESISDTIDAFKDALNDPAIKSKIGEISKAWDGVLSSVSKLTSSKAWKSVVGTVVFVGLDVLQTVLESISGLIDGIRQGIEKLDKNGKLDEFKEAWDGVTDAISDLFNSEGFQALIGGILSGAISILTGALNLAATVINSFKNALNNLKESGYLDKLEDACDRIGAAFTKISESKAFQTFTESVFTQSLQTIVDFLVAIAEALEFIADLISGDIPGAIQSFVKFLLSAATIIAKSIIQPIETAWNSLVSAIEQKTGLNLSKYYIEWSNGLTEAMDTAKDAVDKWFDESTGKAKTSGKEAGKEYKSGVTAGSKNTTVPVAADTSPATASYKDLKGDITQMLTAQVDANISKGQTKYSAFSNTVKGTVTTPINANTASAEAQANKFKDGVKQTTTNPINANTASAEAQANKFKDNVKRTTIAPITAQINGLSEVTKSAKSALTGIPISANGDITNRYELYKKFRDYMVGVEITAADKLTNEYTIWKSFKDYMYGIGFTGEISNLYDIWKGFKNYMNGVSFTATATITEAYSQRALTFKEGRLAQLATGGIVQAASGRFIDSAQMFMARENGIPEYVGRFGSHSAVANNYQIVSGIAEGVSQAMMSQNNLLREQNNLLEQIAAKDMTVSTASLTAGLVRQNRRAGMTVVPVNS